MSAKRTSVKLLFVALLAAIALGLPREARAYNWTSPTSISNDAGSSLNANLAVESNASLHVASQDDTPGNSDIFYATPGFVDNFDDGVIDTSLWSVEVAREGYGIWKLPELPPPFIQATEESGQLRFSGNSYAYFDYARALITKDSFSGSFTLEVDLTSLSGSGGNWGADVVIVKDDFTAIQVLQDAAHWSGEPGNYYAFNWIASGSCIDGTPGCPTSPGGSGTPGHSGGEVRAPSATTFPIKLKVVYNGDTEFRLYWDMSGDIYEYTYNAPEVYDTYRVVLCGAAQLGSDYIDARFDNFRLVAGLAPTGVGGITEFAPFAPEAAVGGPGPSLPPYAALAGIGAGGALLLAAGGWYARKRRRAGY